MRHHIIREVLREVSHLPRKIHDNITLTYEGGYAPDEDAADYLPRDYYVKGGGCGSREDLRYSARH